MLRRIGIYLPSCCESLANWLTFFSIGNYVPTKLVLMNHSSETHVIRFYSHCYVLIVLTFSITEFQDNLKQRLSTNTETERADWIQAIRHASYEEMRKKLQSLREQIEKRRDNKQDIDVDMMRLQVGKEIGEFDLIQF